MSPIDQLKAAADAGMRPTFAALSFEAKTALIETLVPRNRLFSAEERALFAAYALEITPAVLPEIEAFNEGLFRVPIMINATRGTCIPSDALTWCGEGDGFHPLQSLLWSLAIVPFSPSESPSPL